MNNCFQIPFDLKITKLEGKIWQRNNVQELAQQLYDFQGEPRSSVEHRITVVFDESITSSASYFKRHRSIILYRLIRECYEAKNWVWVAKYNVWNCLIIIPPLNDTYHERHQHNIGQGLREKEKAEFENKLLKEVARCSNGILKINPNEKEHGIDGWIWLPNKLLEASS